MDKKDIETIDYFGALYNAMRELMIPPNSLELDGNNGDPGPWDNLPECVQVAFVGSVADSGVGDLFAYFIYASNQHITESHPNVDHPTLL